MSVSASVLPSSLAVEPGGEQSCWIQIRNTGEIAKHLSYSERTIKNVIHDVTTRLQLRNRSQAVAYAMREGLI